MAEQAARLEQRAVALVDANGLYGAPQLYRACTRTRPQCHRRRRGYARRRRPAAAPGRGPRGIQEPLPAPDAHQDARAQGGGRGHPRRSRRARRGAGLPHGRRRRADGGAPAAGRRRGSGRSPPAARDVYGRFDVYVEVQRHLSRAQEARTTGCARRRPGSACSSLATNAPRLVAREDRPLLDVLTCIREHTTLDAAGRLLSQNSERFMKSGPVMEGLFADCPEAVANSGELSFRLGFTLKDLGYQFPEYPLPPGETPIGYLRALAEAGARTRYGTGNLADKARRQIAPRARGDRAPRSGRLLPHRLGPGPVLRPERDPRAGAGLGRQ